MHRVVFLIAIATISLPREVGGAIWAKRGVSFGPGCSSSLKARPITIPSPNGMMSVEVRCREVDDDDIALRIVRQDGRADDVLIPMAADSIWRPQELLWAPDSKAFIVNGSENAYAGNAFVVFHVYSDRVVTTDLAAAAQRDMVKSFPPCKAARLDQADCKRFEMSPQYNMSVLTWGSDSLSIIVFAEVPCTSSYGGIMCQVMGYQIDATTGRILQRINARELKRRYQTDMAWSMKIPDRPEYGR